MGAALAIKRGAKSSNPLAKKVASEMTKDQLKDFAVKETFTLKDALKLIEVSDNLARNLIHGRQKQRHAADATRDVRNQTPASQARSDAAQRQMDAREQQGEDMSNATIDPNTYEIIKNKKTNESFKDFLLSEVSKSTLASYVVKASNQAVDKASEAAFKLAGGTYPGDDGDEFGNAADKKAVKRLKGVKIATHKLASK